MLHLIHAPKPCGLHKSDVYSRIIPDFLGEISQILVLIACRRGSWDRK